MQKLSKRRKRNVDSTEALSPASLTQWGVPQSSHNPRAERTPSRVAIECRKKTVEFFLLRKNRAVFQKFLREHWIFISVSIVWNFFSCLKWKLGVWRLSLGHSKGEWFRATCIVTFYIVVNIWDMCFSEDFFVNYFLFNYVICVDLWSWLVFFFYVSCFFLNI